MAGFLTKALLDTIANSVAQAKDLNTLKDVLSRWLSNPNIGRGLNLHIHTTTWSSGGDKIISGIGFKPSLAIILACDSTAGEVNFCIGFDTVTQQGRLAIYTDGGYNGTSNATSWIVYKDSSNYLSGYFTDFNYDGGICTLTLVGTCEAEVAILFIG